MWAGRCAEPTGGRPEQCPVPEGGRRLLSICIRYSFVAVIEHQDKKQLKEELILALCSES